MRGLDLRVGVDERKPSRSASLGRPRSCPTPSCRRARCSGLRAPARLALARGVAPRRRRNAPSRSSPCLTRSVSSIGRGLTKLARRRRKVLQAAAQRAAYQGATSTRRPVPSLFRFLHHRRRPRRRGLRGHVGGRRLCRAAAARNDPDAARQQTRGQMTAARSTAPIDLFLEMIAAERGAARNTIEAYRRDLADYAAFLAGTRRSPARRIRRRSGPISARFRRVASKPRRRRAACRRSASCIGSC